jgi:glyoxylase-like metal-dependent hydrolase (beta-lactamase superfamily II)
LKTGNLTRGRFFSVLFFALTIISAQAADQPPLQMEQVAGDVWMISGGGYANISVLAGDGRALMVDSKRADLYDQIVAMVQEIDGGDVAYLINGHVHPDHTDGNENFGLAGARIIAHEEVRKVLLAGQRGGPPAPAAAIPELLITDGGELELRFDGETVRVMHMPPAHSLGNVLVHYVNANVMHLGDLYSPERFPVVAGGTVAGFIEANRMIFDMADGSTRYIAGNGVVTKKAEHGTYIGMVTTVRDRVARMIAEGMSEEAVIAARPAAEFEGTYGDPGRFLPALYRELAAQ